jgi:hypothetical protein
MSDSTASATSLFTELETLRRRVAGLSARIADYAQRQVPSPRTAFVGQVVNLGAMPSSAGKFYVVNPVTVRGPETEGGAPTFAARTGQTVYVDVLYASSTWPTAGSMLHCKWTNYRWVSDSRPSATCNECIQVNGCDGPPMAGATVVVTGPVPSMNVVASGTTNDAGAFWLYGLVEGATYAITVTPANDAYGSFTGTFVPGCDSAPCGNCSPPSTLVWTPPLLPGEGGTLSTTYLTEPWGIGPGPFTFTWQDTPDSIAGQVACIGSGPLGTPCLAGTLQMPAAAWYSPLLTSTTTGESYYLYLYASHCTLHMYAVAPGADVLGSGLNAGIATTAQYSFPAIGGSDCPNFSIGGLQSTAWGTANRQNIEITTDYGSGTLTGSGDPVSLDCKGDAGIPSPLPPSPAKDCTVA